MLKTRIWQSVRETDLAASSLLQMIRLGDFNILRIITPLDEESSMRNSKTTLMMQLYGSEMIFASSF
jgi:hypothetical protein